VSSAFRIDYVEAALLALLAAKMPAAYGANVDIESLGDKDFDDNGRLTLQPPSLRVRFAGAGFNNLRDNQRLSYQVGDLFEVLCYESSLRSKADARNQTLVLVAAALDQLAGARLVLADGTKTMPLTIKSVELVVVEEGPVDQLYSIALDIEGIAQYSGANG
jgi:hypothetical protein